MLDLAQGQAKGTLLAANQKPMAARKQWLAGQLQVRGDLILDAGAVDVLIKHGRSLLPVGISSATGDFQRGDLVSCKDINGVEIARGLVNYSYADTIRIQGCSTGSIKDILGYKVDAELIHRDNLVLSR